MTVRGICRSSPFRLDILLWSEIGDLLVHSLASNWWSQERVLALPRWSSPCFQLCLLCHCQISCVDADTPSARAAPVFIPSQWIRAFRKTESGTLIGGWKKGQIHQCSAPCRCSLLDAKCATPTSNWWVLQYPVARYNTKENLLRQFLTLYMDQNYSSKVANAYVS